MAALSVGEVDRRALWQASEDVYDSPIGKYFSCAAGFNLSLAQMTVMCRFKEDRELLDVDAADDTEWPLEVLSIGPEPKRLRTCDPKSHLRRRTLNLPGHWRD
jgi:hypothetical protein